MERKNYKKVDEFIGIAAPHVENIEEFVRFCQEKEAVSKEIGKPIVDSSPNSNRGISSKMNNSASRIGISLSSAVIISVFEYIIDNN